MFSNYAPAFNTVLGNLGGKDISARNLYKEWHYFSIYRCHSRKHVSSFRKLRLRIPRSIHPDLAN